MCRITTEQWKNAGAHGYYVINISKAFRNGRSHINDRSRRKRFFEFLTNLIVCFRCNPEDEWIWLFAFSRYRNYISWLREQKCNLLVWRCLTMWCIRENSEVPIASRKVWSKTTFRTRQTDLPLGLHAHDIGQSRERSAILVRLTAVPNRQTDRHTQATGHAPCVAISRIACIAHRRDLFLQMLRPEVCVSLCLSVCLSVGHSGEPVKWLNRRRYRSGMADSYGPDKPRLRWGAA